MYGMEGGWIQGNNQIWDFSRNIIALSFLYPFLLEYDLCSCPIIAYLSLWNSVLLKLILKKCMPWDEVFVFVLVIRSVSSDFQGLAFVLHVPVEYTFPPRLLPHKSCPLVTLNFLNIVLNIFILALFHLCSPRYSNKTKNLPLLCCNDYSHKGY